MMVSAWPKVKLRTGVGRAGRVTVRGLLWRAACTEAPDHKPLWRREHNVEA